jgi:hypothetical protein
VTIIHGKPFSKRKHYSIASIDKAAETAEEIKTKTEKLLQEAKDKDAAQAQAQANQDK